jgi:hypothetical protein
VPFVGLLPWTCIVCWSSLESDLDSHIWADVIYLHTYLFEWSQGTSWERVRKPVPGVVMSRLLLGDLEWTPAGAPGWQCWPASPLSPSRERKLQNYPPAPVCCNPRVALGMGSRGSVIVPCCPTYISGDLVTRASPPERVSSWGKKLSVFTCECGGEIGGH